MIHSVSINFYTLNIIVAYHFERVKLAILVTTN